MKNISPKKLLTLVILCFVIVIVATVCAIIFTLVDFGDKSCSEFDNHEKTNCECTEGIVTLVVKF